MHPCVLDNADTVAFCSFKKQSRWDIHVDIACGVLHKVLHKVSVSSTWGNPVFFASMLMPNLFSKGKQTVRSTIKSCVLCKYVNAKPI